MMTIFTIIVFLLVSAIVLGSFLESCYEVENSPTPNPKPRMEELELQKWIKRETSRWGKKRRQRIEFEEKEFVCGKCGATRFKEESGRKICIYCGSERYERIKRIEKISRA